MNNPFDHEKIVSHISEGGLFSKKLPHFEVRDAQKEMLRDCLTAYTDEKIATIEAATGTGKSMAYLLAALYWAHLKDERTVISTHTIALQEQLLKKDIPFLLENLGLDLKVVLAKGMHNYLCLRKLEDVEVEKRFLQPSQVDELEKIKQAAQTAQELSRSDLPFAVSSECWDKVAAEGESCTHSKCPHFKRCFFFKARAEAADAHLVIANHHLLFADLSARQESNNYEQMCVLPPYKRLILDEAHHVEDVAKEHFAKKTSRKSFLRLLTRLSTKLKAMHQKVADTIPEPKRDDATKKLLSLLELDLPSERRSAADAIEHTFVHLEMGFGITEKLRIRQEQFQHPLWGEFQATTRSLSDTLRRFLGSVSGVIKKIEESEDLKSRLEGLVADIQGVYHRLTLSLETLLEFAFSPLEQEEVRWIDASGVCVRARLDIAFLLSSALFEKMATTVLCSATLSTQNDFKFIHSTLGIKEGVGKIYASPFDYEKNAVLLVPLDMPHPDTAPFLEHAARHIEQTIDTCQGNAFVLFTSYTTLKQVKERLEGVFYRKGYPLLCQGDQSAMVLLNRFKKEKGAVLFGTDSFWEGVDVVGDALRCVVIVKLPFLVPSDPFFQAKSEKLQLEGKSPFFDYSLPQATMKFKQGFGRLIRSKNDRGCVVCLDARLATKGYGKMFLKTLPPCGRVFEKGVEIQEKLRHFYREHFTRQ